MILRPISSAGRLLALVLAASDLVVGQTYTLCNPLFQTCPPNPALSGSMSHDFSKGGNDMFAAVLSPEQVAYTDQGVQFQVARSGNSPTLASNFFIMYGRVDVTMLSAPGIGIVSSVVLQSDTLDEIDWEWLGGDNQNVQSNYFGKGNTAAYDRAMFIGVGEPQTKWHTYTIDWTSQQIVWSVDGEVKRILARTATSGGDRFYPQTPMQVKVGAWAGGDPGNSQGTINWAGGYTDYNAGPYNMIVRSISVQDYSTGRSYSYSDNTGSDTSIRSDGGRIAYDARGGGGGNAPPPTPTLTDIPLDPGFGHTATGCPAATTPYIPPTSAEEYWACSGFRVSSANPNSLPYIVTDTKTNVLPYVVTDGASNKQNSNANTAPRGVGRPLDESTVLRVLAGWTLLVALGHLMVLR